MAEVIILPIDEVSIPSDDLFPDKKFGKNGVVETLMFILELHC